MELYHVLNRGVDKRDIFLDERDYIRFVHNLYEFNDDGPTRNNQYRFKNMDLRSRYLKLGQKPNVRTRKPVVDIHAWCLMRNHYHFLISERIEGGLTLFIRKLNIGYAKYFNERNDRTGALFQSRTQRRLIDRNAYFLYILHYIHLNPLDYHRGSSAWRTRRIQSPTKALKYLETYRWSSYLDYAGIKNFPSILTTELFQEVFGNVKYATKEYIKTLELDTFRDYLLE